MSVSFNYLIGISERVTVFINRHLARTNKARGFACLAVLCLVPTLALAADALRTLPRAEECIDVARLNSVSEAERAVLRIEWRAGLARAEESRLLNEMYERIERLQRTTNEIRVLMNAIPSPSERAAANNGPSGLGPSALIPPIAAATLRPSVAPTAKLTELPVAPPPLVVSPASPSAVATVPIPAAQAKLVEDLPKVATTKSAVPVAIAEIPTVKMNPLSFGQLIGVGLVSVALVVLWWMRRKDKVLPISEKVAVDSAPPENILTAQVADISPVPAVQNEISEVPPIPHIDQIAAIEVAPLPAIAEPTPARVEEVAADASEHEKTLIIRAYQAPIPVPAPMAPTPISAPAPPPDVVAEIVIPEVPKLAVEIPLDYVPAAPAEIPAPSVAPVPVVVLTPAPVAKAKSAPVVGNVPMAAPEQSEASILELAEMMLAMGLATGAAQKLVDYIRDNPKAALAHWLKLLEIYRENGQRSNFEQAARQLQREFNIRASDWMRGTTDRPRLEKFDRVFSQVESLWNEPAQCIEFLTALLHDNRDGQRVGFPQEVAEEILLLIEILKDSSGLVGAPAQIVRV